MKKNTLGQRYVCNSLPQPSCGSRLADPYCLVVVSSQLPSKPELTGAPTYGCIGAQEHLNVSVWAAKEGWLVEILF